MSCLYSRVVDGRVPLALELSGRNNKGWSGALHRPTAPLHCTTVPVTNHESCLAIATVEAGQGSSSLGLQYAAHTAIAPSYTILRTSAIYEIGGCH
jgi:hypothetical protein